MATSIPVQEIKRLRQEYERGLLSIIVDQDRRAGFELIENAVKQMAGLTAAPDQWKPIHRWLSAQRGGQLALTSRSFGLLRDVGKVLKQLDGRASVDADGLVLVQALLDPVLPDIEADLATLGAATPHEENWFAALRTIATALDAWQQESARGTPAFESLREGFAQIHSLAQLLSWADAREISESLMNMLDRLLDGTLAPSQDHLQVSRAALVLLETLSLPQAGSEQTSQIDDAAYERVIERADVLASGGSFEMLDDEAQEDYSPGSGTAVNAQLATVLEAIPPLVADALGRVDETAVDEDLRAELESLARIAHKLLHRLG